jgi:anti-sigma factor RsiW
LLGAYRRDDWAPSELEALGQHLAACPACRQKEAAYRDVGFGVRQLPSITPPAAFRARVFAAIAAEPVAPRAAVAVASLGASLEETDPRLPAIRVRNAHVRRSLMPQRSLWQRAGLGLAAALLLGVVGARFIPLMEPGLSSLAQSLVNATQPHHVPGTHH